MASTQNEAKYSDWWRLENRIKPAETKLMIIVEIHSAEEVSGFKNSKTKKTANKPKPKSFAFFTPIFWGIVPNSAWSTSKSRISKGIMTALTKANLWKTTKIVSFLKKNNCVPLEK